MPCEFYNRRTNGRNDTLRGADRKGFQGSEASLANIELADIEEPRFELPAVLIDTMRFAPGRDGSAPGHAMTAKSQALYYWMMANARLQVDEQEGQEFIISSAAAKSYLGIDRADRLREYVDAIGKASVTYDLRLEAYQRSASRTLLDFKRDDKTVTSDLTIRYCLDPAVRQVMLSARRYALLELNAFRKFKSKYTARLYPILALVAGQSVRPPLSFAPRELADRLAWMPETFHWGSFYSRVLLPILDDINPGHKKAPAVSAFRTEMELVHGEGRGNPVEQILFHVLPGPSGMRRQRATRLGTREAASARVHIDGIEVGHTPAPELVAQAVTATGKNVLQIRDAWAATVRSLSHDDNKEHRLRVLLETHGVGAAFPEWVDRFAMGVPLLSGEEAEMESAMRPVKAVVEQSKAERMKDYAIHVGTYAMKQANNILPGLGPIPDTTGRFDDDHIREYAHPDMWLMLEGAGVKNAATILKAFGVIAHQQSSQMRKSIYNLGGAIAEWNIPRAMRIAKAIIANSGGPADPPRQPASTSATCAPPSRGHLDDADVILF